MAKKKQEVLEDVQQSSPVTNKRERLEALNQTINLIEKEFGQGSISSHEVQQLRVECLSTGIPSIDKILGGGYGRGRISENYGPEGSGKSTLALHFIATTQKNGGICVYIDAEHEFLLEHAQAIGVNLEELILVQPSDAEEALAIAEKFIKSGNVDVIVVDSVAALTPVQEIEGKMTDQQIGLQGRILSKFFRKTKALINKTHTHLFFVNQLRSKVGVVFGNPEITVGGKALPYFANQRLEIRKGSGKIKDDEEKATGIETKFKCTKNKITSPLQECVVDIIYGKGFDIEGDVIACAIEKGIVEKSGGWFSYKGEQLAHGLPATKELLKNNKELFEKIKKEL